LKILFDALGPKPLVGSSSSNAFAFGYSYCYTYFWRISQEWVANFWNVASPASLLCKKTFWLFFYYSSANAEK
jgi:hypothetical protein